MWLRSWIWAPGIKPILKSLAEAELGGGKKVFYRSKDKTRNLPCPVLPQPSRTLGEKERPS